ncbi:MAG: leucine-rich repeat domain-containing protein [Bacteroidales bacterium]|nr:leucine-rich repeat domain-containing protein [Bacteroidales bacterium]
MESIYLSTHLTTIPERAFFRCKSLKKVVIPKSVRVIESEAFAFCEALEEVIFEGDTKVDESAFKYCGEVRMMIIP